MLFPQESPSTLVIGLLTYDLKKIMFKPYSAFEQISLPSLPSLSTPTWE